MCIGFRGAEFLFWEAGYFLITISEKRPFITFLMDERALSSPLDQPINWGLHAAYAIQLKWLKGGNHICHHYQWLYVLFPLNPDKTSHGCFQAK